MCQNSNVVLTVWLIARVEFVKTTLTLLVLTASEKGTLLAHGALLTERHHKVTIVIDDCGRLKLNCCKIIGSFFWFKNSFFYWWLLLDVNQIDLTAILSIIGVFIRRVVDRRESFNLMAVISLLLNLVVWMFCSHWSQSKLYTHLIIRNIFFMNLFRTFRYLAIYLLLWSFKAIFWHLK